MKAVCLLIFIALQACSIVNSQSAPATLNLAQGWVRGQGQDFITSNGFDRSVWTNVFGSSFWFSGRSDTGLLISSSQPDWQQSGFMQAAVGCEAGFGYGVFHFRAKIPGGSQAGQGYGINLILWNGDETWLVPENGNTISEVDLLEANGNSGFSALHFYDESRADRNGQYIYDMVDPATGRMLDLTQWHDYDYLWSDGLMGMYVDGKLLYSLTGSQVPKDFAHGGCDKTLGAQVVIQVEYEPLPTVQLHVAEMWHYTSGGATQRPATPAPTQKPATPAPTQKPATPVPTQKPATPAPTQKPTPAPTQKPATLAPTQKPATLAPTQKPATLAPTQKPATASPTTKPATPAPTGKPTAKPTPANSITLAVPGGSDHDCWANVFTCVTQLQYSSLDGIYTLTFSDIQLGTAGRSDVGLMFWGDDFNFLRLCFWSDGSTMEANIYSTWNGAGAVNSQGNTVQLGAVNTLRVVKSGQQFTLSYNNGSGWQTVASTNFSPSIVKVGPYIDNIGWAGTAARAATATMTFTHCSQ